MTELATREKVEPAAPAPPPFDPTRTGVSLASLALLALGGVGWIAGVSAARGVGLSLFSVLGIGSALLLLLRNPRWPAISFAAPLGVALIALVGYILVETHTWSAGVPIYWIIVTLAGAIHLHHVLLVWQREHSADVPETRRPPNVEESNRSFGASEWTVGLAGSGLAACLWSAALIGNFNPKGPLDLFKTISPAWYIGLLAISAAIIVGRRASSSILGVAVASLSLALTLTPAIVYQQPRYSWTAKHVGVTAYILLHGSVNPKIDIYQAWPGLFAGVAWLCHAIGVTDPMVIARWWPPVIDLATILVFQRLALRALGDARRSWFAAALLIVGDTIGQDYYSPQATAYLLAIAIFAMVYKPGGEKRTLGAPEWSALIAMSCAIAVTHQLTPYMVTAATVILVLFGYSRSRLIPIATLVPAVLWGLAHASVVKRYFTFNQFGDIAANILTRGLANPSIHKSHLIRLDSYAMAGDALVLGLMALMVLITGFNRRRLTFALCAASGAGLFVANSYGNEGAFRVLLFALPWLAILACDVDPITRGWRHALYDRSWAVLLPGLLAAYVFADMGLDYMNAVRTGDLQVIRYFEDHAPSGSRLLVLGNGYTPIRSTGRYNLVHYHFYPYFAVEEGKKVNFAPQTSYDQFILNAVPHSRKALRNHKIYVLAAQQPAANAAELGLISIPEYQALNSEFSRSLDWTVASRSSTATLYEMSAGTYYHRLPEVIGRPFVGHRLLATPGKWNSPVGLTFAYQWEVCQKYGSCAAIPGATSNTFIPTAGYDRSRIAVIVTATDSLGHTRTAASPLSALVSQ